MNKPSNIINNDWELLKKKYRNLDRIKKKLDMNYPVQYLIGNVNFYGYEISVNKNVLIPRFETEGLVEKTINYIKKYNLENSSLLEIGTGSGCIPITLKKEIPSLAITAIDKSRKALRVAKRNAYNNHTDINFIRIDMFKFNPVNTYSVLISNPPYINESMEIDPKCAYEPKMAIYAGDSGLVFYKHIFKKYKKVMDKEFIMAFEIGYEQGSTLKELASREFKDATIKVEKDLSGRDRYLFIIKK